MIPNPPPAVPEPSSIVLLALGMAVLMVGAIARRRRQSA